MVCCAAGGVGRRVSVIGKGWLGSIGMVVAKGTGTVGRLMLGLGEVEGTATLLVCCCCFCCCCCWTTATDCCVIVTDADETTTVEGALDTAAIVAVEAVDVDSRRTGFGAASI